MPPAQVNLAVTYMNGWGGSQNYGAALNWLNAAAKQGHPSAYANLGILYMNGWGVRRDYAEAFKDLEIAANAGDAGAQSNLGYLYDGGLGVVQDYSAAARWYHLAAENGNALGQNNLADLYPPRPRHSPKLSTRLLLVSEIRSARAHRSPHQARLPADERPGHREGLICGLCVDSFRIPSWRSSW
jgi:hypothetical protein